MQFSHSMKMLSSPNLRFFRLFIYFKLLFVYYIIDVNHFSQLASNFAISDEMVRSNYSRASAMILYFVTTCRVSSLKVALNCESTFDNSHC